MTGAPPARRGRGDDVPPIPDRAEDDSDAGWGERDDSPDRDDDDRFLRERPPHW